MNLTAKTMENDILINLLNNTPHGTSRRVDCPYCYGKKTLSITSEGLEVKYNCFKNSCSLRPGVLRIVPTREEVAHIINLRGVTEEKRGFRLPPYIKEGTSVKSALEWIQTHNGMFAYTQGRYKVGYDTLNQRVVYYLMENNKVVGAVGRALYHTTVPKVLLYKDSKVMPFIVGNSDIGIIVEDCASAASINSIPRFTGIALLGTQMKAEYIPYLKKFKKLIVALDPDAMPKAVLIRNYLQYLVKDVTIWKIPCDFKNMNYMEILNLASQRT